MHQDGYRHCPPDPLNANTITRASPSAMRTYTIGAALLDFVGITGGAKTSREAQRRSLPSTAARFAPDEVEGTLARPNFSNSGPPSRLSFQHRPENPSQNLRILAPRRRGLRW